MQKQQVLELESLKFKQRECKLLSDLHPLIIQFLSMKGLSTSFQVCRYWNIISEESRASRRLDVRDRDLVEFPTVYPEDHLLAGQEIDVSKLESVYVSWNQLTILDLSGMTNLKELDCSGNYITSLIFPETGLPNLKKLYCQYNRLTSLIFPKTDLSNLKKLKCFDNQLTSLILPKTGLSNLKILDCSRNQLTSLTLISDFSNLEWLICSDNKLTELILPQTGLSNMEWLNCFDNQLLHPISPELLPEDCTLTQ